MRRLHACMGRWDGRQKHLGVLACIASVLRVAGRHLVVLAVFCAAGRTARLAIVMVPWAQHLGQRISSHRPQTQKACPRCCMHGQAAGSENACVSMLLGAGTGVDHRRSSHAPHVL